MKKKVVVDGLICLTIAPGSGSDIELISRDKSKSFVECEVNIKSVFAAFYIESGSEDTAKAFAMIGVGGVFSFERNFILHSFKISKIIRELSGENI